LFAARGVFAVQDVLTRSSGSAQAAVAFIGAGSPVALSTHCVRPACGCWRSRTTASSRWRGAGGRLRAARRGGVPLQRRQGVVGTGALRAAGAFVASVHPVRSFADPAGGRRLRRHFLRRRRGCGGAGHAGAGLRGDRRARGAIDASAKTVYHAASVFASNYLVTVLDAALRAYQAAGIPADVARELARPLATETLANVFRLGPETALSGPIARGDTATVARQQAAVGAWDPATGALYEALASATWDWRGASTEIKHDEVRSA
jgi:hypothetical protein